MISRCGLESYGQPEMVLMEISKGIYLSQKEVDEKIDSVIKNWIVDKKCKEMLMQSLGNTLILAIPPDEGDTIWDIYDCQVRRVGFYDDDSRRTDTNNNE
jgi:hypothetical protein